MRALTHYRAALELLEPRLGSTHPHTVLCTQSLARTLHADGELEEALRMFEALAERQRAANSPSLELASSLAMIGWIRNDLRSFEAAEAALRAALTIREAGLPAESWQLASTRSLLGEALAGQGRITEAEPMLAQALNGLRSNAKAPLEGVERAAARLERVRQESARIENPR